MTAVQDTDGDQICPCTCMHSSHTPPAHARQSDRPPFLGSTISKHKPYARLSRQALAETATAKHTGRRTAIRQVHSRLLVDLHAVPPPPVARVVLLVLDWCCQRRLLHGNFSFTILCNLHRRRGFEWNICNLTCCGLRAFCGSGFSFRSGRLLLL